MKKIVSVLALSALTLGLVFADISLEYTSKGYLIDSTSTKDKKGADDTKTTTILDQNGYADATNCLVFSAGNDIAGVKVDFDPNASTATWVLDQYYAWMNIGNLTFTTGLYSDRYVNRVNEDAGKWESGEFEMYKPGIISYNDDVLVPLYGSDVDNLTKDYSGTNRLAFATAYTLKDALPGTLMFKATAVDLTAAAYRTDPTLATPINQVSWGNLNDKNVLRSGLAFEAAYRQDNLVDVNVLFKTMNKSQWVAAAFVRPLMVEKLNALIGFTYGADSRKKDSSGVDIDNKYSEFGIDLRARFAVSDALSLTTMNNISKLNNINNYKNTNCMYMWNMLNATYVVNESLKAQFTVENTCLLNAKYGSTTVKTADAGGYNMKFIPGVVLSASKNASITTGVIFNLQNVGESSDFKDAEGNTTRISVPVVVDIAL